MFYFRFEITLDDKFILHISLGIQGLEWFFQGHLKFDAHEMTNICFTSICLIHMLKILGIATICTC